MPKFDTLRHVLPLVAQAGLQPGGVSAVRITDLCETFDNKIHAWKTQDSTAGLAVPGAGAPPFQDEQDRPTAQPGATDAGAWAQAPTKRLARRTALKAVVREASNPGRACRVPARRRTLSHVSGPSSSTRYGPARGGCGQNGADAESERTQSDDTASCMLTRPRAKSTSSDLPGPDYRVFRPNSSANNMSDTGPVSLPTGTTSSARVATSAATVRSRPASMPNAPPSTGSKRPQLLDTKKINQLLRRKPTPRARRIAAKAQPSPPLSPEIEKKLNQDWCGYVSKKWSVRRNCHGECEFLEEL